MTEQTTKKKMPKGCVLILIFIIAALVIWFMIDTKVANEKLTETTERYKKEWKTISYEEKSKWIKDFLAQTGEVATNSEITIANSITQKFNYPEEVEFNTGQYPSFKNGDVVEADTGFVFFKGGGTAKNAFGVKERFGYQVRTIIRPDTMYIDEVNVFQLK